VIPRRFRVCCVHAKIYDLIHRGSSTTTISFLRSPSSLIDSSFPPFPTDSSCQKELSIPSSPPTTKKAKLSSPPRSTTLPSNSTPTSNPDPILHPPPAVLFDPSYTHQTYPYPIPSPSAHLTTALSERGDVKRKEINDQPNLDLVYYKPFRAKGVERGLFEYLRAVSFFYRVRYSIKRRGVRRR
jgi:hypothetical protein